MPPLTWALRGDTVESIAISLPLISHIFAILSLQNIYRIRLCTESEYIQKQAPPTPLS